MKNKHFLSRFNKPIYIFFGIFFLTLFSTSLLFSLLGFVPKELSDKEGGITLESVNTNSLFGVDFIKDTNKFHDLKAVSTNDLPAKIIIKKINMNVDVSNPESTNTTSLDALLTKGPVRYPGSGILSSGNMFIFGHSTGFKVVKNQAYKVFNQIKTLEEGDEIEIKSMGGMSHFYSVVSVKGVSKYETYINFESKKPELTLSTCDSFGTATDRYVVTAIKK